jgi:aspartyl/asparaginyl beta-hydroxylase (cupin superfamily)
MKARQQHSPEACRRIAERTRAAMASPAVRQKIYDATKLGMKAMRTAVFPELTRLREAWRDARPSARRAFLNELLAPSCEVRR